MNRPDSLTFLVPGIAQPQGSARAFMPKGAHFPVVTHDNPTVKSWRREIYAAAEEALAPWVSAGMVWPAFARPAAVRCAVSIFLPRPKSLPKRVKLPSGRPDADKLLRACLDALTGLVWADDSQVCEAWVAKSYGDPPRAEFEISLLDAPGGRRVPGMAQADQPEGDLFPTAQIGPISQRSDDGR